MTTSIDVLECTARQLQSHLSRGDVSSESIIPLYLEQIKRHDGYLKAMIDIAPEESLRAQARKLDQERRDGCMRGRLHGIPIIVKDNVATHPDLGMRTTAGSLALATSKPSANAALVDKLIKAGAIIIGKANLSELSYWKGSGNICGWSAVGGQTQSAYVRGGVQPDDFFAGHSNPGGSSAGSAVAVSAGYAPISIGTETRGSLVLPANRAALYTIKPSIGKVDGTGVVPVSLLFDQAGPMAKSAADVADLLEVLVGLEQGHGYTANLSGDLSSISFVGLKPEKWLFPDEARKPNAGAAKQMIREAHGAYDLLKSRAKAFQNVSEDVLNPEKLALDGRDAAETLLDATVRDDLNGYLASLRETSVRTLEDIINFNRQHADQELPPGNSKQNLLEKSQADNISTDQYNAALAYLRLSGRAEGIDKILQEYQADAIIGPVESKLWNWAAAAGYPICSIPIGYLDFNGRPHGLAIIASANQEGLLIQIMSAWEAMTAPRRCPARLRVGDRQKE